MRKVKDNILNGLVWLSAIFTIGILVIILGFIFVKGIGKINLTFLTSNYSAGGGGGILPMIVTTLWTVLLSLAVATPIGVLGAVYLQEYAKQGKMVKFIRFATESLAGIPSIVYGLFGGIFFVVALKTVPESYREASLGLGATKFQTLYKVILPSAMPGILSGVILSIGRIIGESAAILLTAGTVAQMPKGIFSSARTLTVQAYLVTKEKGDIETAAAVGIVLIVIILALNISAKLIAKKFNKANY